MYVRRRVPGKCAILTVGDAGLRPPQLPDFIGIDRLADWLLPFFLANRLNTNLNRPIISESEADRGSVLDFGRMADQ